MGLHWALGIGHWALGIGQRALGSGHWAAGIGQRVLGHQGETTLAQELEARAAVVLHRHQLHRGPLASPKHLAGRLRHPQRLGVPPMWTPRLAWRASLTRSDNRPNSTLCGWPRLEAALRLIWCWRGRAAGRIGRSLWAAAFHTACRLSWLSVTHRLPMISATRSDSLLGALRSARCMKPCAASGSEAASRSTPVVPRYAVRTARPRPVRDPVLMVRAASGQAALRLRYRTERRRLVRKLRRIWTYVSAQVDTESMQQPRPLELRRGSRSR